MLCCHNTNYALYDRWWIYFKRFFFSVDFWIGNAVRKERKWRPLPFESPLTITFFWCTDLVISVHPKLKTWKNSCLLILPSKPHGTPENSVVFPHERAECLEPSVNKNFSILPFYDRGKSWENECICKITRRYAYSMYMCMCVRDRGGGENQLFRECSGTAYWCWVSVPIRSAFSMITDVYFCDAAGVLIIIPAKILHL